MAAPQWAAAGLFACLRQFHDTRAALMKVQIDLVFSGRVRSWR